MEHEPILNNRPVLKCYCHLKEEKPLMKEAKRLAELRSHEIALSEIP